jgi:glycosyltransferase involved in cell wall biosynthesis
MEGGSMSIGILSCVWQRPERLSYTLSQLEKQTSDDWHLYLINNNPSLKKKIASAKRKYKIPMTVVHNTANQGPYARWLTAKKYTKKHSHFMTVDDDLNFDEKLVESWEEQLADEVKGWMGFIFEGDYWHRKTVEKGEACHYVWGSNMVVPADVIDDPMLPELPLEFVQSDDLWLCYIASHIRGLIVRRGEIDVSIEVDGKDTYPSQHRNKIDFLESLRKTGWANI